MPSKLFLHIIKYYIDIDGLKTKLNHLPAVWSLASNLQHCELVSLFIREGNNTIYPLIIVGKIK